MPGDYAFMCVCVCRSVRPQLIWHSAGTRQPNIFVCAHFSMRAQAPLVGCTDSHFLRNTLCRQRIC